MATFFLDGDSLLSKWGFNDGEALGDYWWAEFDEPAPFDEHVVLRKLVRSHLVPAIEAAGHSVEVYDIPTSHNPIRASVLDGEPVDDYENRVANLPSVELTADQVREAAATI